MTDGESPQPTRSGTEDERSAGLPRRAVLSVSGLAVLGAIAGRTRGRATENGAFGAVGGAERNVSGDALGSISEEDVDFVSGDVTLGGTIVVPDEPGPKPALVLIHGSGPGPRELTRPMAEAFASEGIVSLVYDKRTDGYSQSDRSYDLLADDALAAVDTLRDHPDVDPDAVGLWGVSEGGWVAPLAATRSDDVASVVLVGSSGVPPAQQQAWSVVNGLHHRDVSGSLLYVPQTLVRVLVAAEMFPEATYDPVAVLEHVEQPVLAIWGEKDRVVPVAESAQITQAALKRGGNTNYTVSFFPDAEHALYTTSDGFDRHEHLAPGYPEAVAAWVKSVANGEPPEPSAEVPPPQAHDSRPVTPLAPWESIGVQLGVITLTVFAFVSYPVTAVGRLSRNLLGRRRPSPSVEPEAQKCPDAGSESRERKHLGAGIEPGGRSVRRWARLLASTGLVAMLGTVGYALFLLFTGAREVGFVIVGRPLLWLALQALALVAVVSTVALAISWRSTDTETSRAEQGRLGTLLVGGVLFVLWAVYWGLLVP